MIDSNLIDKVNMPNLVAALRFHYNTESDRALKRTLADAAAAIEDLQKTLKAVQTNSGINFRMWEEAQAEVERLKADVDAAYAH